MMRSSRRLVASDIEIKTHRPRLDAIFAPSVDSLSGGVKVVRGIVTW